MIDYATEARNALQAAEAFEAARNPGAFYEVCYRDLHDAQRAFVESTAKRKVIRAGRRGGKTVGVATLAVRAFEAGRRVLYTAPTADQCARFWSEVKRALQEGIDKGALSKNETLQAIEKPRTENRIRAKTAWDADSLRGDYADLLIMDEFQLTDPSAWQRVGAPMLLDNNGDAAFVFTPPTIRAAAMSKAADKRHASKLFKKAEADKTGRWAVFHFSSRENPYLSTEALDEISSDMTRRDFEHEILALDRDDAPGALWSSENLELLRVHKHPELERIVVAVDPSATSGGDECGIIVAGVGMCACKGELEKHGFVLEDASIQGSPQLWAARAVGAYNKWEADKLIAEQNMGGEMVSVTISTVQGAPPVKLIHASRGKQVRAEPVSSLAELGKLHHVGEFDVLEDELTQWQPGGPSPNRLDALVYAVTELMLGQPYKFLMV